MHRNLDYGWIDVITSGSMYAGKTTELIRRIRTYILARRTAVVFQPGMARRFTSGEEVVSHDGVRFDARYVDNPFEMLWYAETHAPDVIGIDEVQFFPETLPEVVQELANRGHYVIAAGLAQTSEGRPFGCMPHLLALADSVTSVYGVCVQCGEPATKSFALQPKQAVVEVGAGDKYEARCRKCWVAGRRQRGEGSG